MNTASNARRLPRLRMGLATLLLLTAGAGSAAAQPLPAQGDKARVEVRTWSNAPARPQAEAGADGGVLLDAMSAEALLALAGLGASIMAVRSATRKEV